MRDRGGKERRVCVNAHPVRPLFAGFLVESGVMRCVMLCSAVLCCAVLCDVGPVLSGFDMFLFVEGELSIVEIEVMGNDRDWRLRMFEFWFGGDGDPDAREC